MSKTKFPYTLDFQWDLVKYICQDPGGLSLIPLVEDEFFEDLEHAIIVLGLKKFYKKYERVPGPTILKEWVVDILNSRDYINLLDDDEKKSVLKLIGKAYKEVLRDSDIIKEKAKKFYNYSKLKPIVEEVDLTDYSNYEKLSNKISDAIKDPEEKEKVKTSFLIADIKSRQLQRQDTPHILPTPFRQVNNLTNAGGYSKGSIIVILDKPKRSKTALMINLARGYMKMRKKVAYIDFENGKDEILIRLEQSIAKRSKQQILSGEHDDTVQKQLRKYKRLGSELVAERFSANVTNANHIKSWLNTLYVETGFKPDVLLIDYAAKMASISGQKDDTQRISDVYIELGNLAEEIGIDHIWTPHHVTRDAKARERTRYEGDDIAKCIDIVRHVQGVWGLNRTPEEEEQSVLRMEIVEQRDGKPRGRALFITDQETQRFEEFNSRQRHEYDLQFADLHKEGDTPAKPSKKERDL